MKFLTTEGKEGRGEERQGEVKGAKRGKREGFSKEVVLSKILDSGDDRFNLMMKMMLFII